MTTKLTEPTTPAIQFFPSEAVDKRKRVTAGWEPIRRATMVLMWEAVAKRLTFGLLAWGMHGNGLTSLPKFMFHELNRAGLHSSLLQIRTRYLESLTDVESDSAFSQVGALLDADQQRPMIVAFDELELLRPAVGRRATLGALLSELLGRANGGRLIVLGITSRPDAVDASLAQGFAHGVHLHLPDVTATADLLAGAGVPGPSFTSRELFNTTAAMGMRPTFRGLCDAVNYWQITAASIRGARTADIANVLATACNVVADSDYDDYLERNEVLYARAKHFLELWTPLYGDHFPGDRARRPSTS